MGGLDPLHDLLACLRGELPERPDWQRIIALANRTLCSPMISARLQDAGHFPSLPVDVRLFLEEMQARNGERNRRLLLQLDEAAASLEAMAVRPLLLKGTAWLASAAPEWRGERMLADLDLMISPTDQRAAIDRLTGLGYRLQTPVMRPDVPVVLWRPEDAATIDLHCEYGGTTTIQCRAEDVMRGARSVILPHSQPLLPSPVFQVAILLLHDQLKGRDYLRGRIDLRHLLDIQSLACDFSDKDWDDLEALFNGGYARNAVKTQLLTARKLLGLKVPDRLVKGIRPALQYRRRMIQARWPAMALPLTLLSLLDPCYLEARRSWKSTQFSSTPTNGTRSSRRWLPRRASLKRLLLVREPGKV